jgi:hypothetical protein
MFLGQGGSSAWQRAQRAKKMTYVRQLIPRTQQKTCVPLYPRLSLSFAPPGSYPNIQVPHLAGATYAHPVTTSPDPTRPPFC